MLEENGFPITPLILGVVLGGMLEENFISSMIKSDGNVLAFFSAADRGVALGVLTIAIWFWPLRQAPPRRARYGRTVTVPRHVRVHRAARSRSCRRSAKVRAKRWPGSSRSLAWRAVGEGERVRRAVVVAPGHRRAGGDGGSGVGANAKLAIEIAGAAAAAALRRSSGWTTILRGALPTAIGRRPAARRVDRADVVRAFVGDPDGLAVGRHPVRLLADRDSCAARRRSPGRTADQLARALDDDRADRRAGEPLAEMRRRAGRDLADAPGRCRHRSRAAALTPAVVT